MKKSDIKTYKVTDRIFVDSKLATVATEMWTAQDIIDTLLSRKELGYRTVFHINSDNTIELINFI